MVVDKPKDAAAISSPAMIRIQDVCVEYGQPGKVPKRVLNGVSLDIEAGGFVSRGLIPVWEAWRT